MVNGVSLDRVGWHGVASSAAAFTAVVTLCTVVFLFGKSQARLDSVEAKVAEVYRSVEAIKTTVTGQSIQQGALAATSTHVEQRLERITNQLEQIQRGSR